MTDQSAYLNQVENDIAEAKQIRATGVPFFVFNNKYAISGAQPQTVFQDALEKVTKEAGITPKLETLGSSDGVCGPDGCSIN